MATVTKCDLCGSVCTMKEAFVVKVYTRYTMDQKHSIEVCPECCDKILKELKQEATN